MTELVITPVLREMEKRGHPFCGILYAGLMITQDGPYVLEYNVRFGDPECQPLLMRLNTNLLDVMEACLAGRLDQIKLDITPKPALGVVLCGQGYPGRYASGMPINGIDEAQSIDGVKVFLSGATYENDVLTARGGRILCVTALGDSLPDAQKRAYNGIGRILMENGHYRTDIGNKGIKALR
jgi:phosphoribosylamine--glycine ligase